MAHNLVRAAGALASLPFAKARAATIRLLAPVMVPAQRTMPMLVYTPLSWENVSRLASPGVIGG